MINKNTFFPGSIKIFPLVVTLLLIPLSVSAKPSDSTGDTEVIATDAEEQGTNVQSLQNQLKLLFDLRETTDELTKEESGIGSLNDLAGQTMSRKQLIAQTKKIRSQLAEKPQDLSLLLSLGSILETLGDEDQALAVYEQALTIKPENLTANQGVKRINRSRRVVARVYYSFQHQEEYAASIDQDLATWEEQVKTIQVSKSWGKGKTFGLGWLESSIYQTNDIYGDVDYSLKREAPFVYVSWPILENTAMSFRLRDEKFTNDDLGYYRVDGDEHIITGYLALSFSGNDFWANFNYSREREPDPVYDINADRSALNIEVKELTGVSVGYTLIPSWELSSSLYYEQYGSAREDQLNPNLQVSHWLSWIPGTRISLGYGYYTEEDENIINLTTSYQYQPLDNLQLRLEYQLEYSSNEDSLLNQGDIIVSWAIVDRLSLVVRADYSQETGGDEDTNFYAQASLNWARY
jgi:tetratricopeptide (TPR) repeat protein